MKITGKHSIEIEIDKSELAQAIMDIILEKMGVEQNFDDAGCDWMTKGNETYIGGMDWKVSDNPYIANLVNTFNILIYDKPMVIKV